MYLSEQARELDRRASKLPEFQNGHLMKSAGRAAFHLLQALWPDAHSVAICCGPGNNGGDAFVMAELAAANGYRVNILRFGASKGIDAQKAAIKVLNCGISEAELNPTVFSGVDVIVDGMLGTGKKRPLSGMMLEAVRTINKSRKPVLALDSPTGLNSDTGAVENEAVDAAATICFICLNLGIVTGNGPDRCGDLFFDSLDLPKTLFYGIKPVGRRIQTWDISVTLDSLPRPRHKGDAGHLLVVGGATGMSGAARLAGEAALRAGAGSVSIATRKEHAAYLNLGRPELMVHGTETAQDLMPLLRRSTAVLVGPGLGLTTWSQNLMAAVVDAGLPMIVDADGINLLTADMFKNDNWILTPHPGEAGRLLGLATAAVQGERLEIIRQIQEKYGGVCVLKGAGTLVLGCDSDLLLCDRGNPGMASAGMGDVLAGVIGSFVVQGLNLKEAAGCGAWLHSVAGDLVASGGERGMVASDLLLHVCSLVNNPALADV
jgi:NAD(P)H-hydrate epimerase